MVFYSSFYVQCWAQKKLKSSELRQLFIDLGTGPQDKIHAMLKIMNYPPRKQSLASAL